MIKLIAVGKIKEGYLRDAVREYEKRLSAYTKLRIVEVTDEMCPQSASEAQSVQIRDKEGRRILEKISDRDYVITLEISGRQLTSEELAQQMEQLSLSGHSDIDFIIGGSLGLSGMVSQRADLKLSFSKMTFPHQLMRVILLEQLYRSYKINRNEPYHK